MKKYFKQYKQALSAVLISMMVLQPISSLPSAWATEYDPEAVFDIEDEDAWLYEDEEDGNIFPGLQSQPIPMQGNGVSPDLPSAQAALPKPEKAIP